MAAAEDKLAAIRKQVEFYFSDANFRRDKFMQTKAGEDPQGCESGGIFAGAWRAFSTPA